MSQAIQLYSTSRRAVLAAGAAAVAVATVPVSAARSFSIEADPAIGLSQQLRAANKAWSSAEDAYEEATNRVGLSICYGNGLVTVETSDGPACWGAEEIKAAAEDGRLYHRLTPEERDAALAEIEREKNAAHKKRLELGIETLRQEVNHWKDQYCDLKARLLDTPATTLPGVLAKLRGFYHDGEIAQIRAGDDPTDALGVEWAASVYRDLERLAEGAGT